MDFQTICDTVYNSFPSVLYAGMAANVFFHAKKNKAFGDLDVIVYLGALGAVDMAPVIFGGDRTLSEQLRNYMGLELAMGKENLIRGSEIVIGLGSQIVSFYTNAKSILNQKEKPANTTSYQKEPFIDYETKCMTK
jgi:hypothetical protein